MKTQESLEIDFKKLSPLMNEKAIRMWAASEAHALGRSGVSIVSAATKLASKTIRRGLQEFYKESSVDEIPISDNKVRRSGAGRKSCIVNDPNLVKDLEILVDPATRGDPMSPLKWSSKSTDKLTLELKKMGHNVGVRTVARLLHRLNYSLQSNRKSKEGSSHVDRDKQFSFISKQVQNFQEKGQPVVSVDTKKNVIICKI
jgi:hypothetical protein